MRSFSEEYNHRALHEILFSLTSKFGGDCYWKIPGSTFDYFLMAIAPTVLYAFALNQLSSNGGIGLGSDHGGLYWLITFGLQPTL